MDRPEPGLIKWSPNVAHDSFLHINLQHRVVRIYAPTGHAQRGRFDYRQISQHDDFPPLTTYDWSPSHPGLLAVGTATGVVNLLRVDDGSNAYLELGLKMSRTCQAVAFNTAGHLAVGLDRVRSDNCLYIWDTNRLAPSDAPIAGFTADIESFTEAADRLEPSVSVSSVKFFEDNPNILVAGIKAQGLRIHDLRDRGHGSVAHFQTKCCNNLAIDYADQNYFASSALDQPGIMVWDRRATQRLNASPVYLDAIDQDDVPWGGALRLDHAMHTEAAPVSDRHSLIRSLRFCRDHSGMLAVLSRTGQLKLLSAKREHVEPDLDLQRSPELLEVRKSYEMDPMYADPARKNDRIVSFDWVTLNSPVLQPRLLVLRAGGAFDILEKPSFTATHPFKMVPWQSPHRGFEAGGNYHEPIELDPSQSPNIYGPLAREAAFMDVPLFGPDKPNMNTGFRESFQEMSMSDSVPGVAEQSKLSKVLSAPVPLAEKLQTMRLLWRKQSLSLRNGTMSTNPEPVARQQRHDEFLMETQKLAKLSRKAEEIIDHIMLLRAKERYLFEFARNQQVVSDDCWLQDVWAWVAGSEEAASYGKMSSHGLDLEYMGVYTLWNNDLGNKSQARLADGTNHSREPNEDEWEQCLHSINKRLGIPQWDGAQTKRPRHRAMCLDICKWGRANDATGEEPLSIAGVKSLTTSHTRAAAHALFQGDTKEAVAVLKKASIAHSELLFVSLALQLMEKNGEERSINGREAVEFDERLASKTDPYLRAISSVIATRDWAAIANQRSLPLRDRVLIAVRHFSDDALTDWLREETQRAIKAGDIEGIVLTGITDPLVDILACFVAKFGDHQTATLLLSVCAPRFIDDVRATAFRSAYRQYLHRHRAFFLRAKFDVESTKRSKLHGRPTLRPMARQITLRCVYCDVQTSLSHGDSHHDRHGSGPAALSGTGAGGGGGGPAVGRGAEPPENPFTVKMVGAGISCPNCKRHLPRCVVCLEVIGMRQQDGQVNGNSGEEASARRFPSFCLKCEHVLHLEHARQWFARHAECPVPECRCKCNVRANPELDYQ